MKTKIIFLFFLLLSASCGKKDGPLAPPENAADTLELASFNCQVKFRNVDSYQEIATKAYLMSKQCGASEKKIIAAIKAL
jgi:hypothetical protein